MQAVNNLTLAVGTHAFLTSPRTPWNAVNLAVTLLTRQHQENPLTPESPIPLVLERLHGALHATLCLARLSLNPTVRTESLLDKDALWALHSQARDAQGCVGRDSLLTMACCGARSCSWRTHGRCAWARAVWCASRLSAHSPTGA